MIRLVHIRSKILKNRRRVFFYLPPGWDRLRVADLPVLYMQDGQNVFADVCHEVPFQWDLDRVVARLMLTRRIPRMMIVGLANTAERTDEYTPTRCSYFGCGGNADRYLDFITEEVAPFFRRHFPVSPLRTATAIGGSSLGGLLSLYAALTRPADFGIVLATSPSIWWDRFRIFKIIEHASIEPSLVRLWVDIGRHEMGRVQAHGQLHRPIRAYRYLDKALQAAGFTPGRDYGYFEQKRGTHDERSWGRRMRRALPFLFGCLQSARACQRVEAPCEHFAVRRCPMI